MAGEAPKTSKHAPAHNPQVLHPGIKLRHTQVLLDVAERGSLTAAARARGLTQPALSRSLAEIEAMPGRPFLVQAGRRLQLTEAGTAFRRRAAEGLVVLEAGRQGPGSGRGGARGPGRSAHGRAARARRRAGPPRGAPRHGALDHHGAHGATIAALRKGEIDPPIGRMPAAAEMAGLAFEHPYEEEVVLATRAGHPFTGRGAADLLRSTPAILPPAGAAIRRIVDDHFAAQGLLGLRRVFGTVVLPVGRRTIQSSDAAWFIPREVIAEELAAGAMWTVATGSTALAGSVGITKRQGRGDAMLDLTVGIARV